MTLVRYLFLNVYPIKPKQVLTFVFWNKINVVFLEDLERECNF